MNRSPCARRMLSLSLLAIVGPAVPLPLLAQSAPAGTTLSRPAARSVAPASAPATGEDAVVLSPFQVSENSDVGYQARESLSTAFVELQEKRHLADYDLTERFSRSDVLALIEQAETVIKDFASLAGSNERKFFLACLWAWSTLATR